MKKLEEPSSFYYEAINLIDLDDYDGAINSIRKNIDSLENLDDIALAYLNCGFLNDKLGENISAIDDFSKSIFFESKIDIIKQRSKDISFSGRSNSRYKTGDYQGAIDDKRKAKNIRLLEIDKYNELSNERLCELTKLRLREVEKSKNRLFTNPIFWKDTNEKLLNFKSDVMKINKGLKILKGGRFLHISDNYNKAKAVKNFIKTIKSITDDRFLTVSLGDSENDISMLESTDYSCIVKRKANKISLKKKDNIYFSKTEAPDGWRESLEFVIRMESKNF